MLARPALEAPPFEVTENGWGEFEVLIKIYFKVPSTKTVTLRHFLKLFPGEDTLVLNKKILVKETYDEFVSGWREEEGELARHWSINNGGKSAVPQRSGRLFPF